MKTFSLLRISIVIALALGITTFWAAATPSAVGGDLFTGGWTAGAGCCDGSEVEGCEEGTDGEGNYPCEGGATNVCLRVPDPPHMCQGTGCPQLCTWKGSEYGPDICTTTEDTECSNDSMPCPGP